MKHERMGAVPSWEQLGTEILYDETASTGTPRNIKNVAGQKDAIGFEVGTSFGSTAPIRLVSEVDIQMVSKNGFAAPGAGTVYVRIWNKTTGAVIATIGSFDANSIGAGKDIVITISGATWDLVIAAGNPVVFIGCQLVGGDAANYIIFDTDAASTAIDGKVRTNGNALWDAGAFGLNGNVICTIALSWKYDPTYINSVTLT
jgi:hypothetical protein